MLTEESVNCGNTLSKATLNCSPWCCSSNIHLSCASVVEARRCMIYSTLFQQCNLVSLDLASAACHHFAATTVLFGEVKPDRGTQKPEKMILEGIFLFFFAQIISLKTGAKTEYNREEGSLSAALSWGYTRCTRLIPAAASVLLPRRCPLLCLSSLNRRYATYAKLDGWRNRLAAHPFNLSRHPDPSPANTRDTHPGSTRIPANRVGDSVYFPLSRRRRRLTHIPSPFYL